MDYRRIALAAVVAWLVNVVYGIAIIGSLYRRSDQREPSRATAAGRLA